MNYFQELVELKKPKQPANAYALFVEELSKKISYPLKQMATEASREWKKLTDSEKEVYTKKAKLLREEYEKELTKWEEKMKSEGREDLIRKRDNVQMKKKQSRVRVHFLKICK